MANEARVDLKLSVKGGKEAESALSGVAGKLTGLGVAAAAAAAAGLVAAGAALVALTKQAMDQVDAQAKVADKLGLTTQGLAAYQYAAGLAGVSNEGLTVSLQMMNRTVSEAARGVGGGVQALKDLNLSAQELRRMGPEKSFEAIAQRLGEVDNAMDRTRLAMEIFGRGSSDVLNMTADGIEDARRKTEALGLAMSRVDAAKIEAANDALSEVGTAFGGIGRTLAVQLSPYIQAAANWFVEAAVRANGWRDAMLTGIDWVIKAVGFLADMLRGYHVIFHGLQQVGHETVAFLLRGLSQITNAVMKAIDLINLLPGVQIEKPAWAATLQREADLATEKAAMARAELEALAMAEMPSTRIKQFFSEVQAQAQQAAEAVAAAKSGMTGSGLPADDSAQREKEAQRVAEEEAQRMERLRRELEQLDQHLMSVEEREFAAAVRRSEMVNAAFEAGLIEDQRKKELLLAIEEEYELAVDELQKRHSDERLQAEIQANELRLRAAQLTVSNVGTVLEAANAVFNGKMKALFILTRTAAAAGAIINGHQAAMAAVAPPPLGLGPVFGPPLAKLMLVAGYANAASIMSQAFTGQGQASGSFGGGSGGYGAGTPTSPTVTQPAPYATQQEKPGPQPVINVNVYGNVVNHDEFARELIPSIAKAVKDGYSFDPTDGRY